MSAPTSTPVAPARPPLLARLKLTEPVRLYLYTVLLVIDNFEHLAETTGCTLGLREACNTQTDSASMLQHNEELDAEGDWLEIQRVVLVDAGVDTVVLARVFKIADTVTLPCLAE